MVPASEIALYYTKRESRQLLTTTDLKCFKRTLCQPYTGVLIKVDISNIIILNLGKEIEGPNSV